MRLLLSLILFVSISSLAPAQSAAELLDQLKAELRDEIKADKNENSERPSGSANALASIARLDAAAIDEGENSSEVLLSLGAYTTSEKAQDILAKLAEIIRKKQKEKDAAYTARADAAIQQAKTALVSAKTAADLDALITSLGELANTSRNSYSNRSSAQSQRLQGTLEIAKRWQDYLFKKENGDLGGARDIIVSLANNSTSDSLIPRSQILALTIGPKPAPEKSSTPYVDPGERAMERNRDKSVDANTKILAALDNVKTLADLDVAIRALRQIKAENAPIEIEFLRPMSELQRNYLEFQNGITTTIDFGNSYGGDNIPPEIIPLRAQLLLLALPRYLGLSEPAGEKETPYDYLTRVIKDSKAKGNWDVYARATEALRIIGSRPNSFGYSRLAETDSSAVKSYLAGVNQEKAGQYASALISYRSALLGTGEDIPPEHIGARIAAIEKEHPEAIQQAKKEREEVSAAAMQNRFPPGFMPRPTPPPTPEPARLNIPPAPQPPQSEKKKE
jgi:hypothetical protein